MNTAVVMTAEMGAELVGREMLGFWSYEDKR